MTLGVVISIYELGRQKHSIHCTCSLKGLFKKQIYSHLKFKRNLGGGSGKIFVVLQIFASSFLKRKKNLGGKLPEMLDNVYRDTLRDFLLLQKKKKKIRRKKKKQKILNSVLLY